MHPRGAVGCPAPVVDLVDPLAENTVFLTPPRRWPVLPVVIAAARDAQHAAHQWDRKARSLRLDEPITAHRVPSSLAKKAAAFFKNSLSCLRPLFSRRSLRSSSRSSLVSPSRSPWSISDCLTHVLKELPETPRALAICEIDLPEERTSCTASALNWGGYRGFALGTQNSFLTSYCAQCSGVRGAGSIPVKECVAITLESAEAYRSSEHGFCVVQLPSERGSNKGNGITARRV